jgi:hypothetical protein
MLARGPTRRIGSVPLTEDEVKYGVKEFLEAEGFHVTIAWGRDRGVDIQAVSPSGIMLLEAKGSAPTPAGELLPQRSGRTTATNDRAQRCVWTGPTGQRAVPRPGKRLPQLARERLRLTVFFISKTATGTYAVEQATQPSHD